MRDVIVFILITVFFGSGLFSRFMALIAYWWFGIFRPHDWVWNDLIASLRLPLVAAALLVIPSLMQGIYPTFKGAICKLAATFLTFILIAKITTGCMPISSFRSDMWFQFSVLIFVILLTVKMTNTTTRFFWLTATVGLSLAFHAGKAGISSLIGVGGTYYGASTMTGPFTGSNGFALGSAVLLFFNLYLLSSFKNGNIKAFLPDSLSKAWMITIAKIGLWILVIGIAYNVISLFSRGSFLAMCGGLVLWLMLNSLLKFKHILLAIPIIFLTFQFAPLPDGFKDRISSAFVDEEEGQELDRSAASRPHFWNIAFLIAKDYPQGVGPGCYNTMYPVYDSSNGFYGRFRTVHSSHFQVLAEGGFIGVILWLSLFFVSVKQMLFIRRRNKEYADDKEKFFYYSSANMIIASQAVFFVGGAFYAQAYNDIIWLIWALSASLHLIYIKNSDKKEQTNDNGR